MNRFTTHSFFRGNVFRNLLLLCIFLLALFALYRGTATVSAGASMEQKRNLEKSVTYYISQCYALEGAYPPDMQYLEEHYGFTYDHRLFYIDYRPIGSNLRPDVTIIPK